MKNNFISKPYLKSLLWKQNHWHKHGVLLHTLRVTYYVIKNMGFNKDFILAGLLHDVGKPLVAYQDEKDKTRGTYSFTNHEEVSYQVIKNWNFISNKTKDLVRYHYIIRDLIKSKEKNKMGRYNRLMRSWNKLDSNLKEELNLFLGCDDLGKGYTKARRNSKPISSNDIV